MNASFVTPVLLSTIQPAPATPSWVWGLLVILGGALVAAFLLIRSMWRRQMRTDAETAEQIRALVRRVRGSTSRATEQRFGDEPVALGVESIPTLIDRASTEFRLRLEEERRKREALEAVLSSMAQGVVAIDLGQRLLSVNPAAALLLGVDAEWARGRPLLEVVRNELLQRTITAALETDDVTECEIVLAPSHQTSAEAPPQKPTLSGRREEDRRIIVRSKGMHDADGNRIGAIMAFHDISRLRRLEKIRQDFVANVSHELRTPITTIKGCIETLLDGSDHDRETADRFLNMISRQAHRLHATLEDVLTLASLEGDPDRRAPEMAPVGVVDLLRAAVDCCRLLAQERSIRVDVECPADLQARLNGAIIEQALVNLIENAIKYSPEGSAVLIRAEMKNGDVQRDPRLHNAEAEAGGASRSDRSELDRPSETLVLSVRDNGIGISREHHDRIFERFYRVDRGRSRAVGGTGLGLSIVKHIAQAHGGEVSLESAPGKGSTFSIRIPITRRRASVS